MAAVRAGAATDRGLVRHRNEDAVLAGAHVFAVADGMGGQAAGDIASALAVAALRRVDARPDRGPADVRDGLARANDDILASAAENPARAGMGTTVAGLSLVRVAGADHWAVFNVGDSRVYRFSDDALVQLTVDHAAPAQLVGRRGVITRALGTDPAPEADLWVFPSTPGERFLVCSDGLSLELADAEIAAVLRSEPAAQAAADRLVKGAVTAGGRDNVSAVVVDTVGAADELTFDAGDDEVDVRTGPRSRP